MGLWNNPPYYLSAYGLAVKHGFVGSEKKWLQSLKGDPGTGLTVVDSFETEEQMRERYPSGILDQDGFVRVGSGAYDYLLYYWDAEDEDWYSISIVGPQGKQGDPGPAPIPVSESYAYAISSSGTTPPTSGWVSAFTDPDEVKGKFVWTRTMTEWSNGEHTASYSSAYNGADATGAVISINGKDGVVNLVAENIPASDERNVQEHLTEDEENIAALQEQAGSGDLHTIAQDLVGAVNEIKAEEENITAGVYDATATYAVGDYAIYRGALYRCTTAIQSAEAWTPGHWTRVCTTGEIKELQRGAHENESAIEELAENISTMESDIDGLAENVTALEGDITTLSETEVIVVNIASYSGSQVRVPATGTNPAITANHVLLASTLGTPSAQTGDWTVNTYDGYLTLSGTATGTTTVKLVLGKAGTTI